MCLSLHGAPHSRYLYRLVDNFEMDLLLEHDYSNSILVVVVVAAVLLQWAVLEPVASERIVVEAVIQQQYDCFEIVAAYVVDYLFAKQHYCCDGLPMLWKWMMMWMKMKVPITALLITTIVPLTLLTQVKVYYFHN